MKQSSTKQRSKIVKAKRNHPAFSRDMNAFFCSPSSGIRYQGLQAGQAALHVPVKWDTFNEIR